MYKIFQVLSHVHIYVHVVTNIHVHVHIESRNNGDIKERYNESLMLELRGLSL